MFRQRLVQQSRPSVHVAKLLQVLKPYSASYSWVLQCKSLLSEQCRQHHEPCIVNCALDSIKGHGHPPGKAFQFNLNPASLIRTKLPQAPLSLVTNPPQVAHTSFLNLYISSCSYSNTEKMDIGYYALMVRITLNFGVHAFILTPLALSRASSSTQKLFTSPLWNSKRVFSNDTRV